MHLYWTVVDAVSGGRSVTSDLCRCARSGEVRSWTVTLYLHPLLLGLVILLVDFLAGPWLACPDFTGVDGFVSQARM